MTAEALAAGLKQIYAVIACADSPLLQFKFLHEIAALNELPPSLVIADFEQWQRRGGRPA